MKRVIVGGISHETSTFTPVATTLERYRERFLLRGGEILEVMRGTNTPIGGYIDGAVKRGFELIPTLFAEAHTSAPTLRPLFDSLVNELLAAGVGVTLTLDVGGKSSPLQGEPVRMTARVVALSDGKFCYDGPMFAGLANDLGPSAHIEQDGIHVLLTTLREQPFDTALARTRQLDPRRMRYIGVKSAAHFRAGFESWVGAIHVVSEPSVHNLGHLPFKRLNRRLYPFHQEGEVFPTCEVSTWP